MILFQPILFPLCPESSFGDAEQFGSLYYIASGMGYGGGDFCFFKTGIIKTEIHVNTACRCVKFKILLRDDIATGFQHGDTYNVFKFTDITGPRM